METLRKEGINRVCLIAFNKNDVGNAFWNNIFDILYQELHSIRWFTITVNAVNNILYSIMLMLVFTFIITLFSKFRTGGYLKFFGIFKVTIYNLTPFIFCLIFSILFNLHFLTYIGYIPSPPHATPRPRPCSPCAASRPTVSA